ncbi:MAG: prolyl oligopeptidase family serine peptidase [Elusimicrobiota bacterium]|nr:MAG: prolyl oligopeptidase family serine peptidase [Elusimicrobiota bacterium]
MDGEYGDPEGEERDAILGYSPYQNLRKGAAYPRAFFVTSTKDDRVHPGHARKMVARMRELGFDPLYYENIEGARRRRGPRAARQAHGPRVLVSVPQSDRLGYNLGPGWTTTTRLCSRTSVSASSSPRSPRTRRACSSSP